MQVIWEVIGFVDIHALCGILTLTIEAWRAKYQKHVSKSQDATFNRKSSFKILNGSRHRKGIKL